MENSYKKLKGSLCCLVTAALLAACTSTLSYNEAIQKNVSKIEDTEKHDDARFLVEAASYNMLATRMAEQAIKSGYSNSLVTLAQESLDRHQEMGKEIRKLGRKEKIVLPGEPKDEHAQKLAQLTTSDRRDFDRTYIRLLREAAEEDSDEFARMATAAKSEDIRAFAARKLDLFKTVATELETVDAELLNTN